MKPAEKLHIAPSEGPCEVHDWPSEGFASRLVALARERHGKGGVNICRECAYRAHASVRKAGPGPDDRCPACDRRILDVRGEAPVALPMGPTNVWCCSNCIDAGCVDDMGWPTGPLDRFLYEGGSPNDVPLTVMNQELAQQALGRGSTRAPRMAAPMLSANAHLAPATPAVRAILRESFPRTEAELLACEARATPLTPPLGPVLADWIRAMLPRAFVPGDERQIDELIRAIEAEGTLARTIFDLGRSWQRIEDHKNL